MMQVLRPIGEGKTKQVSEPAEHLNQSVTTVDFVPEALDSELVRHALSTDNDRTLVLIAKSLPDEDKDYAVAIYEAEQILDVHASGHKPAWVDSSDTGLAKALATYFDCAVGEPINVLSSAGRDALHEQHIKSTQPAPFKYGALSASAHTPVLADASLEGEITTPGGGLIRAEMTFAHTAGTNTSTLTKTWAANGTDALPVVVKNWANFNKATEGGTMGEQDVLSATATLSVSGDSLTVTFTLTAG
jgi:hypothetical protein